MDEWLYSEETGEPFSHCVSCHLPLLETAAPWLVNKEFQSGECVLEYAICQPCRDELSGQISEESKLAVRGFLEREIAWDERLGEFMGSHKLTDRLTRCIACRVLREDSGGHAISALFDSGGTLVTGALPLLMCQSCVARMTADLSAASRGVWRKFLENNFAGPPGGAGFPGMF